MFWIVLKIWNIFLGSKVLFKEQELLSFSFRAKITVMRSKSITDTILCTDCRQQLRLQYRRRQSILLFWWRLIQHKWPMQILLSVHSHSIIDERSCNLRFFISIYCSKVIDKGFELSCYTCAWWTSVREWNPDKLGAYKIVA